MPPSTFNTSVNAWDALGRRRNGGLRYNSGLPWDCNQHHIQFPTSVPSDKLSRVKSTER